MPSTYEKMVDSTRRDFKENLRLKSGAILGSLAGLLYSLIAENINTLALPGVPLFDPPPGTLLRIVITLIAGAIIGVLVAWPEDAIVGVIIGAAGTAFLTSLAAAQTANWDFVAIMLLFVYTFLPRAVISLPVAAVLRWASSSWETSEKLWVLTVRKRAIATGALLALAAAGGYFSLHGQEVRFALNRVNQEVQAGMRAGNRAELPESLRDVPGFLENARGPYSLQPSSNPDALAVQRPIVSFGTLETLVIIRFENGYQMGCVDAVVYARPYCWIY